MPPKSAKRESILSHFFPPWNFDFPSLMPTKCQINLGDDWSECPGTLGTRKFSNLVGKNGRNEWRELLILYSQSWKSSVLIFSFLWTIVAKDGKTWWPKKARVAKDGHFPLSPLIFSRFSLKENGLIFSVIQWLFWLCK